MRPNQFNDREVGTFWGENSGVLVAVGIIIFLLGVLILFTVFSPASSPPRFIPPLSSQPDDLSFPWQERWIIPIHWSGGHHGNGHHGHHGHHGYYGGYSYPFYSFPHYYQGRPSIFVDPWYEYRFSPWGYDGGYRGFEEPESPRCFELRQPDGAHVKWCL